MTRNDTVRLTYAELAEARSVSLGAARRMVHRHKWPKQVGNDGLSRISVPAEFVTRSESVDRDVTNDVDGDVRKHVTNDVTPDVPPMQIMSLEEALAWHRSDVSGLGREEAVL